MTAAAAPHAVILAGGRGTRFWPLSRARTPKQLLDLTGEGSLLALTVERIAPLVPPERQWIITSELLADAVREAAPGIPAAQVIAEPMGRNTAPAVALAAMAIRSVTGGDAAFAVLPSDHLITPAEGFRSSLARALDIAAEGKLLLTFGLEPSRPETGYGYIEAGSSLAQAAPARKVASFREKPDRETAQSYLEAGSYFWNSGMFAWRTDTVLEGLRQHRPGVVESLRGLEGQLPGTSGFTQALQRAYDDVTGISIDYALMEQAGNAAVLPADWQWNDVGHWLAMRELWPQDPAENAVRGRVLAQDSRRCIVYAPGRLTALLGVDDVVVVHTDDVTLVCAADRAQDVGKMLKQLEEAGDDGYL